VVEYKADSTNKRTATGQLSKLSECFDTVRKPRRTGKDRVYRFSLAAIVFVVRCEALSAPDSQRRRLTMTRRATASRLPSEPGADLIYDRSRSDGHIERLSSSELTTPAATTAALKNFNTPNSRPTASLQYVFKQQLVIFGPRNAALIWQCCRRCRRKR
jgi:hypothetical protein